MPPNMDGEFGSPANELAAEQQDESGEDPGDSMTHEEMLEEAERRESVSPTLSDELEVQTADAFESNLQDLVDTDGRENVYVEIPQVDLKYIIAENEKVHEEIDNLFNHQANTTSKELFSQTDEEYFKFKRSAQKEVNYLVKEFECRKAADSMPVLLLLALVFLTLLNCTPTSTTKIYSRKFL